MRRNLVVHLMVVLLALSAGGPAAAAYHFWNVTQTPDVSIGGNISFSHGPATLVAWSEGSNQIWSKVLVGQDWRPAVHHGAGESPTMGWGRSGVVLAYVSGTEIVIREGNGVEWNTPVALPEGAPIRAPDVWCSEEGPPDPAYLVWEMTTGEVRFSRRTDSGWSPPETVFVPQVFIGWGEPHVRPTQTPDGIVPRVYFFNMGMLKYSQLENDGWTPPVSVPGLLSAGTGMDVAVGPDLRHHLLSLAPQPG
jgi:hypothetical protein